MRHDLTTCFYPTVIDFRINDINMEVNGISIYSILMICDPDDLPERNKWWWPTVSSLISRLFDKNHGRETNQSIKQ